MDVDNGLQIKLEEGPFLPFFPSFDSSGMMSVK